LVAATVSPGWTFWMGLVDPSAITTRVPAANELPVATPLVWEISQLSAPSSALPALFSALRSAFSVAFFVVCLASAPVFLASLAAASVASLYFLLLAASSAACSALRTQPMSWDQYQTGRSRDRITEPRT
jgi:hypothetical protein